MTPETTAAALAARIDALEHALRCAGVAPERSAGLLAAAAEASLHAVTLDALRAPVAPAPARAKAEPAEQPVPLAA
ncbi:MAG: hypothetical protein ACYDCH_08290 [Gaiellaceae bacterium]